MISDCSPKKKKKNNKKFNNILQALMRLSQMSRLGSFEIFMISQTFVLYFVKYWSFGDG
jgi:hypothetical protein